MVSLESLTSSDLRCVRNAERMGWFCVQERIVENRLGCRAV